MTLIFLSFFAGIISFLSPCVLPLIPGYLSFICGTDLENLKKQSKYFIVKKSALFVLGFSIIFILLGSSSTFFGTFLLKQSQVFSNIIAIIIIFFGLYLTEIINFKFIFCNDVSVIIRFYLHLRNKFHCVAFKALFPLNSIF